MKSVNTLSIGVGSHGRVEDVRRLGEQVLRCKRLDDGVMEGGIFEFLKLSILFCAFFFRQFQLLASFKF